MTVNQENGTPKTYVLINKKCDDKYEDCKIRTFSNSNSFDKVSDISNSMYAFMMDYDSNGKMDITLVVEESDGSIGTIAYYNNYQEDSYYMSATVYTHSSGSYGDRVYGIN